MRYLFLGSAQATRSGAWLTAYVSDGVPGAEVHASGTMYLDELRELRAMVDATIKRLETAPSWTPPRWRPGP